MAVPCVLFVAGPRLPAPHSPYAPKVTAWCVPLERAAQFYREVVRSVAALPRDRATMMGFVNGVTFTASYTIEQIAKLYAAAPGVEVRAAVCFQGGKAEVATNPKSGNWQAVAAG